MSVLEKIPKLSKDGRDDVLLDYIYENYDETECELNGDEYKEPKNTIVILKIFRFVDSVC